MSISTRPLVSRRQSRSKIEEVLAENGKNSRVFHGDSLDQRLKKYWLKMVKILECFKEKSSIWFLFVLCLRHCFFFLNIGTCGKKGDKVTCREFEKLPG